MYITKLISILVFFAVVRTFPLIEREILSVRLSHNGKSCSEGFSSISIPISTVVSLLCLHRMLVRGLVMLIMPFVEAVENRTEGAGESFHGDSCDFNAAERTIITNITITPSSFNLPLFCNFDLDIDVEIQALQQTFIPGVWNVVPRFPLENLLSSYEVVSGANVYFVGNTSKF